MSTITATARQPRDLFSHKRDGDYTSWAEEVKKHFSGEVLVAKDLTEF